jgi:hypothetical protein
MKTGREEVNCVELYLGNIHWRAVVLAVLNVRLQLHGKY